MEFRALASLRVGRPLLMRCLFTALLAAAPSITSAGARARPRSIDVGQTGQSVGVAAPEPAGVEIAGRAVATELEVRYLANEGFLVEAWGRRVLVDGLFGTGISGYDAVPPEVRSQLERGAGSWGNIQVAIATHHHGDHFDPESVIRFLEANPEAVFVSTPQAVERLTRRLTRGATEQSKSSNVERSELLARVRAVLPAEGAVERMEFDGIELVVLNLHHGRRDPPVENLGLVITIGDRSFIHFGDTEARLDEFEPYLDLLRDTDLALLPFWFLSSEWRARMVRDLIQPRWIVVAHMPTPEAGDSYFGRWQSYDNLVRSIRSAFPEARFPARTGESYRFGDN